jgi:thioredoxin-related protein
LFEIIGSPLRMLLAASLLMISAVTSSFAAELVMLEEDGCPWCELWREEVGGIYSKTKEGKVAPLRVVDIHDSLPDDLKFMVKGGFTPTFVLIDQGKEIGRIRGYPGESFFWGLLSLMIDKLPKSGNSSS